MKNILIALLFISGTAAAQRTGFYPVRAPQSFGKIELTDSLIATALTAGPAKIGANKNLTSGAVNLASEVTGITPGANGGTGVDNSTRTITIAGNVTHAGAFAQTFTATGTTSLNLPTTGTLATLAGSEALTNKSVNGVTLTAAGSASNFLNQAGAYVPSGTDDTFTPTVTGTANITGTTAYACHWQRSGNAFTVWGKFAANVTSSGATSIDLSVPVNTPFPNGWEAVGTASSSFGGSGPMAIVGSTANTVRVSFTAASGGSRDIFFHYSYFLTLD